MAAAMHTTATGEMLDLICFRHYGVDRPGAVEAVLEANFSRGLSEHPPRLPRGIEIVLPDLGTEQAAIERATLVKLWD